MRKFTFAKNFWIILIFFCQLQMIFGQGFGRTPLKECWRIESDDIIAVASDNVQDLFISSSDGFIESINKSNGKIIWHTDIGGEIIPIIINDPERLYIVSRNVSRNPIAIPIKSVNETESADEFTIRSLSRSTGITHWQKTFSIQKTKEIFFFESSDKIYIAAESGSFFAYQKQTGEILWEKQLALEISTLPFLFEDKIFIGTTKKKIEVISAEDGREIEKIEVNGIPKSILTNGGSVIFVGDSHGNISSVDLRNRSVKWKTWTGAEITSISKVSKGLLISSFDNYIYLLSEKNGKRLWKKRLSGRSVGQPLIKDNVAVFTTFGGTDSIFIELEKGKPVNQLFIRGESYFISNPEGFNDLIVFPTSKGVLAYSTENVCQGEK